MDILHMVGWGVAVAFAIWWTMRVKEINVYAFWKTPLIIWEDFRDPPKVACFPMRPKTPKEVSLFIFGVLLWLSWMTLFALSVFWGLSPWIFVVAETAFLWISLPHAYADSALEKKLRSHCTNPAERQAWLSFFERLHPDLARLKPMFRLSMADNPAGAVALTFLVVSPLYPLLFEAAISGMAAIAFQILMLSLVMVITLAPLIHWAGAIVGGRYAWWVEYHIVKSEPSTR